MKQKDEREWIDRAVDWLDKMELWGMTLITKVIAALTPIPVSLQTRKHAAKYLGYETPWDWVIAIIVEFLGYAAIYKALQFAEHNRRYSDPKNKAPFKLAIATYIFYLIAVIVFNVIPEWATGQTGYIVAMNIVLALFSVPGGVLAGISAIFTERKAALRKPKPNTEQANSAEQPNTEQGERRTPRTPNASNERTAIPQPAANERRTFSPFPNEQNDTQARIEQAARTLEAQLRRPPSVREIQQHLRAEDGTKSGWSTSTISGHFKRQ